MELTSYRLQCFREKKSPRESFPPRNKFRTARRIRNNIVIFLTEQRWRRLECCRRRITHATIVRPSIFARARESTDGRSRTTLGVFLLQISVSPHHLIYFRVSSTIFTRQPPHPVRVYHFRVRPPHGWLAYYTFSRVTSVIPQTHWPTFSPPSATHSVPFLFRLSVFPCGKSVASQPLGTRAPIANDDPTPLDSTADFLSWSIVVRDVQQFTEFYQRRTKRRLAKVICTRLLRMLTWVSRDRWYMMSYGVSDEYRCTRLPGVLVNLYESMIYRDASEMFLKDTLSR